jgi:peptidoglycan/xylan/chitin deacetylase (PgdA/CDA1 family)
MDGRDPTREPWLEPPAGHDPVGGWQPAPRPRPPVWQSARLAGLLAVALIALIAVALLAPGLDRPAPTNQPGPTPPGSAVGGIPTARPEPTFVRPTPTPQPTFLSYLVVAGDSLNSIARRFDTTARSIAFWNRTTYPSLDPESEGYDPGLLQIGWRLVLLPGVVYGEDGAPSPTPGAPTPPPATPNPSRPGATPPPTTGGPSTVISHGPRGTNRVALTFDMGGRLDPAVEVMEWLVANGVKATIFPTGKQGTEQELGRDALDIVRRHPELFDVGNHSWDHPSFTDLSAAEMRDQLQRAEDALLPLLGRTTRPYFRPPFGSWNGSVRDAVGRAGWGYTVMWDVDTIDWRPTSDGGPTAQDIEAKVLANASGGSIVLMHLGGWHTLEALPDLVAGLRARGLEPVTLSELLAG